MSFYSQYLLLCTLLACLTGVNAGGAWCLTNGVEFCDYGCCGEYPNTECCPIELSAGTIVAIVIVSLVVIAGIIACILACVVTCNKKGKTSGTVRTTGTTAQCPGVMATSADGQYPMVYAGPGVNTTYIHNTGYGYGSYPAGQLPPIYSNTDTENTSVYYSQPPPPYSY